MNKYILILILFLSYGCGYSESVEKAKIERAVYKPLCLEFGFGGVEHFSAKPYFESGYRCVTYSPDGSRLISVSVEYIEYLKLQKQEDKQDEG